MKEVGLLLEPEMGGAMIWFSKEKAGAGNSDGRRHEKYRRHGSIFATGAQGSRGVNSTGGLNRLFSGMPRGGMAPLFAYVDTQSRALI